MFFEKHIRSLKGKFLMMSKKVQSTKPKTFQLLTGDIITYRSLSAFKEKQDYCLCLEDASLVLVEKPDSCEFKKQDNTRIKILILESCQIQSITWIGFEDKVIRDGEEIFEVMFTEIFHQWSREP